MNYTICRTKFRPELNADWNAEVWACAETAEIKSFRPESSAHRPQTLVRVLHNVSGLEGIFKVRDQYVRCTRSNYFDEVWKDSCVEFFIQPKQGRGYFNFEFNCGGAFLCSYITDHRRAPGGFKEFVKIPADKVANRVRVKSSLPRIVDPEIATPIEWTLQFSIHASLLDDFAGPIEMNGKEPWRGNFYKCAEEVSHPHWASWAPVPEFNFHLPECFGTLELR